VRGETRAEEELAAILPVVANCAVPSSRRHLHWSARASVALALMLTLPLIRRAVEGRRIRREARCRRVATGDLP